MSGLKELLTISGHEETKNKIIEALMEAVEYLIKHEPKDGETNKACTWCDMGGAGYSTKGDGHHDDIRRLCPVLKATEAGVRVEILAEEAMK